MSLELEKPTCECNYSRKDCTYPNCISGSVYANPMATVKKEELLKAITSMNCEYEGIKLDNGKPHLSLIPSSLLLEVGKVLTYGANKYAAHNWRKGIHQSRLISAALRHIVAYNDGEDIDAESQLPHLAHAICELAFCLEQQLDGPAYHKFDDRYKGGTK